MLCGALRPGERGRLPGERDTGNAEDERGDERTMDG
jgi:hypothetical protein